MDYRFVRRNSRRIASSATDSCPLRQIKCVLAATRSGRVKVSHFENLFSELFIS
jgi:hypothetical protein